MKQPTVISIFCGTGGSSLGYCRAGYKELLAIDFDKHAVECFGKNFPDIPVWNRDVTQVTGKEILDFCNLKVGELDVFDGSPPCQGFSTAGKRKVQDSRNDLFNHYCRLVKEIQPKVFVMENVTGMVKGKMKGKFIEIINTLKSMNYKVKCKKMNSKYYNVPQSRERLIFIGVRKDLNIEPSYPTPNGKDIKTVRDAIDNILLIGPPPMKAKYQEIFKYIRPGKGLTQCVPKSIIMKYAPRMITNKNFQFAAMCKRVRWNLPCPTITKTFIEFSEPFIHPEEHRYMYISELCSLCSFPIDWILGDSYIKAYERLGNAVMPNFMKAIAENIKINILNSIGGV